MSPLLRPGLALLAAVEVALGLWTLLFPASFYIDVPTVDLTPPFSEHLFRDFGGATLGLAVVLTRRGRVDRAAAGRRRPAGLSGVLRRPVAIGLAATAGASAKMLPCG